MNVESYTTAHSGFRTRVSKRILTRSTQQFFSFTCHQMTLFTRDRLTFAAYVIACLVIWRVLSPSTFRRMLGESPQQPKQSKRIERPPPTGKSQHNRRARTGKLVKPRVTAGIFRQPMNPFKAPATRKIIQNNASRPEPMIVPEPNGRVVQPGVKAK